VQNQGSRPVIKVAIFDLDDTLYDCFGQRVMAAHRYASEAMVTAGVQASVDAVFQVRMEAFRTDPRLEYIDAKVCRHFRVHNCEQVTQAARAAFFSMPVGELQLFPGTLDVLRALQVRGVRNFIVTFGDPETQRRKVSALGLDHEPAIERIHYTDSANSIPKDEVFAAILTETGVPAAEVVVVGDRPCGEIRAGKSLGMRTVRIRQGEFASLDPASPEQQADYEITSIDGVLKLPLWCSV
jgi:FMN phosphatase YigB (HAD superfamily)